MAMIALGYKDCAEVVEKIDQIVMARRRENPAVTYSRARFLREAVNRALHDLDVTPPKIRTRVRETTIPEKPVAPGARA